MSGPRFLNFSEHENPERLVKTQFAMDFIYLYETELKNFL
jgi:hypothetical protein